MRTPNRREALKGLGIAGGMLWLPGTTLASVFDAPLPLDEAATQAWLYGMMPIASMSNRAELLTKVGINQLYHHRSLASPSDRWVTSPNNDTVYSNAWLDLSAGPIRLAVPEIGDRYASFALMDIFGNNFTIFGSRTTGEAARSFTLVGPDHSADDPLAVRAPTNAVWFLARLVVDGPLDLARVHALQDAIDLDAAKVPTPVPYADHEAPWPDYFASVQRALAENPPPLNEAAFFQRISPLGLGMTGGFDAGCFDEAEQALIDAGVARARSIVRQPWTGEIVDGWLYIASSRNQRPDYARRAQVALNGFGGLPREEAVYVRHVSENGQNSLAADRNYRIHFPADQLPPVDGFWSLSMYEIAEDSRRYFFENAIDRYSIGDRTPGLWYNDDGSLDLWLCRKDPGGRLSNNWLPLPSKESSSMTFRAYLPRVELIDGTYRLPPVTVV